MSVAWAWDGRRKSTQPLYFFPRSSVACGIRSSRFEIALVEQLGALDEHFAFAGLNGDTSRWVSFPASYCHLGLLVRFAWE